MARAMERVARHVDCAVVSSVTLDELADASSFHSVTTPRLDTLRNLAAGEAATAAKLEAKVLVLAPLCVVVHTALTAGPCPSPPSPPLRCERLLCWSTTACSSHCPSLSRCHATLSPRRLMVKATTRPLPPAAATTSAVITAAQAEVGQAVTVARCCDRQPPTRPRHQEYLACIAASCSTVTLYSLMRKGACWLRHCTILRGHVPVAEGKIAASKQQQMVCR